VVPGERRILNKRVVEALANQAYTLELDGASAAEVWAYRKAAWAIEDLPQDLRLVHSTLGLKGLESIPGIGPHLGREVERILAETTLNISN
jgi:DNA polymerase/3'-5' exonuclease PolX